MTETIVLHGQIERVRAVQILARRRHLVVSEQSHPLPVERVTERVLVLANPINIARR